MDVEKGEEPEQEETEDEEDEEDRRMREEEEKKKEKKRQEFIENIHVFVAFGIIFGMAALTVFLNNYLWPDTKIRAFKPLQQQVCCKP